MSIVTFDAGQITPATRPRRGTHRRPSPSPAARVRKFVRTPQLPGHQHRSRARCSC